MTSSAQQLHLGSWAPPLNDGVAATHVAKALTHAPRVITVLRTHDLHGIERHDHLWSQCHVAGLAFLVRRPVFTGDGGKTEFVVADIRRQGQGSTDSARLEWWAL